MEFPINTIPVDVAFFTASDDRSPSYSSKVERGGAPEHVMPAIELWLAPYQELLPFERLLVS